LTDEELKARVAIADRLGSLALAGDARKGDAYADCFAEDGVLDLSHGGGATIAGREAIRAWMKGPSPIAQPSDRPPSFISHHITSSRIEITGPDSARGRSYFLVTSTAGVDHNGYYDDVFRKEGDAWLVAHRRPRTLWISPASVMQG
jgi:hypothetical protein